MKAAGAIAFTAAWLGLPAASPASAVPGPQCKANGEAALAAVITGRFADAVGYFSPVVAGGVTPNVLRSAWDQLTAEFGAFRKAGSLAPREIAGNRLLVAPLTFERGGIAALVDCDADNRLTTFRLVPAAAVPGNRPPASVKAPTAVPDDVPGVVSRVLEVPSPQGPLPGVLDVPEGAGPFPAVVFAAGSGPNDYDETIGPNKPFRDLAVGLAKAGVASLRFDKRARVYAMKMSARPITVDDDETDDVLTAATLLARQAHVDPDRLFVLGHSEGAMLAPRIAARDPKLAGIVMLAAPARPLLDVLSGQIRYLGTVNGVAAAAIARQEEAIAAERRLLAGASAAQPPGGEFMGAPQSFWLSLHDYRPVAVAQSLTLPILILQGGNDYQVSPTLDFDHWKRALAGRVNVTFHLFPGLSHLFMPGPTRSPTDYTKPAHVDPGVIRAIAEWIKAQPPAH